MESKGRILSRRALLKAGGLAPLAGLVGGQRLKAQECAQVPSLRLFRGDVCKVQEEFEGLLQDPDLHAFLNDELLPILRTMADGLRSTPIPQDPPPEPCATEAGDANGDGRVDLADPIRLLTWMFQGGSGPVSQCRRGREVQVPTSGLSADDRSFLRSKVHEVLPELLQHGPKDGPPPMPAEVDAMIDQAIDAAQAVLESPTFDPSIAVENNFQDFTAAVIGDVLVATDKTARSMILMAPAALAGDPAQPDVQEGSSDAEVILLSLSLTIELLGLIVGLAGLVLPQVNMAKILDGVRPFFTSPTVRAAIRELARILADKGSTITVKAQGIIQFLTVLSGAGALSKIVGDILDGLSWLDYLKLALQLTVFITSFFISAGAATAARLAVALANSLVQIVGKIEKLVK